MFHEVICSVIKLARKLLGHFRRPATFETLIEDIGYDVDFTVVISSFEIFDQYVTYN